MGQVEELKAEVNTLRERLSLLSEASLRINESLDFETVLQGVLESARSLTGARYGSMLLYDDKEWIVDFVFSGVTAEQARQLWEMTDAMKFQKHLGQFMEPLRLKDFHSYNRTAGLPEFDPPFPVSATLPLLLAPILYRGERVGIIYLLDIELESASDDKGREFTVGDEEALVMFASQAAQVISNARIHRVERRARAYFETLLNTTPVGVLVFDAESEALRYANREAASMVGEQLLPGGSLREHLDTATYRNADGREIPPEELPAQKVMRSGEVLRAEEIVIESRDGRSITTMMNATPIRSDEGNIESVVVSVQDITPIAEMEKLRAEFLGIVGHELRTPLTSIKGSASTLLDTGTSLDPAETLQYHQIINEQADYMRDLIGDLIDVVRIETGTLSVNPEPTEVARLVDEGRNTFLTAGGRDNIRINLMPNLPPVMADRRRIAQVINNLLANAARSSHAASAIRVDAALEGVYVAVSVADSGRGVPAERLPHLFQKFSRPEDRDKNRGLGLGLVICKGIVEAHGGRIRAESDGSGLGSRFTFTIPTSAHAPASGQAARVHTATPSRRVGGDQIRVLAVDDEPRTLKHVRDSLANAGYSPVVTGDPTEVPSLMEETRPHVVLLDWMLPGTDGIELMRDIHASQDTPVIFLSAYDQDELIAKAFQNGAVDYIVKPFSPTELAARVNAALRKKAEQPVAFELADLAINYGERSVAVAGRYTELTPIEYRLLTELSANAGAVLTHDQLLKRIWGPQTNDARPLRTAVKNLRRKLGDEAGSPKPRGATAPLRMLLCGCHVGPAERSLWI